MLSWRTARQLLTIATRLYSTLMSRTSSRKCAPRSRKSVGASFTRLGAAHVSRVPHALVIPVPSQDVELTMSDELSSALLLQ